MKGNRAGDTQEQMKSLSKDADSTLLTTDKREATQAFTDG